MKVDQNVTKEFIESQNKVGVLMKDLQENFNNTFQLIIEMINFNVIGYSE